jgi:hypothetical protein
MQLFANVYPELKGNNQHSSKKIFKELPAIHANQNVDIDNAKLSALKSTSKLYVLP